MTLDIRFLDSTPKQYKHVRKTVLYMQSDGQSQPELVLTFADNMYPTLSIALSRIGSVQTTPD